jgi:hypothetical protein
LNNRVTAAASPRLRRGLTAFFFTLLLALVAVPATAGAYVHWSSGYGLGQASLDGSNPNRSFVPAGNVQSLARDADHLYYVSGNDARGISRVDVDGTDAIPNFIPLATPWLSGIAVDDQHIYWTNAETGNIGRANIDGTGVNHTFITGGTFPWDVTVDGNYIYWSNYGTTTIGRANLDGTGVNQGFISSGLYASGLAVNGSHIYWGNVDQVWLHRANLDGTGVNYGFLQTEAGGVHDVAVDSGHIYWAKASAQKIGRAALDGASANHGFIAADSSPGSIVVGPDTEPPSLTINSGPNGPTADTTPTFGFTAGADAAAVSCSVDTGTPSFGACSGVGSHTSAQLAQGNYTFRVRATDGLANQIVRTRAFEVETVPPDTTITSGPTGLTTNRNPSFGLSSTEVGSTYECSLNDGDWASCDPEVSYELLDDGSYTFAARAIDPAGNTDPTPATRSFTVDGTLPEMSIDSAPPSVTSEAVATFTFSSPEADVTFECSMGSFDEFTPCSSPMSYDDLGDGDYRFLVRAVDAAGNFDPDSAWGYRFTIDRTAPDLEIDSGPSGATPDATPTFGFYSDEGGDIECSIDKGTPAFGPCSGPDTHTPSAPLAAGSYTFRVRAWDEAGNSTTLTRSFSVTAPVSGGNCDAEARALATAQVEASEAEVAHEAAAAKVKKAKTTVKKAKAKLKRVEGDAKKKAEAQLKKAKKKLRSAQASLRGAVASLDAANVAVADAQGAVAACQSA